MSPPYCFSLLPAAKMSRTFSATNQCPQDVQVIADIVRDTSVSWTTIAPGETLQVVQVSENAEDLCMQVRAVGGRAKTLVIPRAERHPSPVDDGFESSSCCPRIDVRRHSLRGGPQNSGRPLTSTAHKCLRALSSDTQADERTR